MSVTLPDDAISYRIMGVRPQPPTLNSVQISNFRGLEAFEVNNFAQINVIVGDNSVGKTTLLEAIFLTLSGSPDKSPAGMKFDGTGEVIPNSFLFAAQTPVSAQEAATHYTNLTKMRQADKFRRAFMSVFDDIADLSVGTASGVSTILADVPWAKQLLPLPALSGGTNRASAILLALAQRSGGVVLVDEIESGIYHTRQGRLAKALITMAVEYQSQLIMTTHSNEWLENFIEAAHGNENSIAFWRMERTRGSTVQIRRFSMSEFAGGMITGEMR